MAKQSAGILLYRRTGGRLELLLVHPGGPFWRAKDRRAWSIPKGELAPGEDPLAAARREFREETGMGVEGEFLALGAHRQPGGKTIVAWAHEGDFNPAALKSNLFSIEWPPRSGRTATFPEADKAAWFSLGEAQVKVVRGQRAIIAALAERLDAR